FFAVFFFKQKTAYGVFTSLEFRRVLFRSTARIDFLVQPDSGEIYLTELNTLPGSLAFYLWQAEGLSPSAVVEQLVTLAREAHAEIGRASCRERVPAPRGEVNHNKENAQHR